jgi:hypothetical protein
MCSLSRCFTKIALKVVVFSFCICQLCSCAP